MADYPYGLSTELSPEQRARLEATTVPFGHGVSHTAADLVVGWAAHVTRLHAERGHSHADHPDTPRCDTWNPYDYVAALLLRRRVGRLLGTLDADLREPVGRAVNRFDDLLCSFTEPDARGLVRRLAADDIGDPTAARDEWWWDRIPTSGPVRDGLDPAE